MIFGTSLIGSYMAVRGVSLFAGNFPNEITLFSELGEGISVEIPV